MLTSTRYQISYPALTRTDIPDVPQHIKNVVDAIEKSVMYGTGAIGARPAFGIEGRVYLSTDETPKVLYWDTGAAWVAIGSISAGSVGTTQLADGSVTTVKVADGAITSVKLADGSVILSKIPDNTVTAAKLVDALVPSRGAGAATEALRAIGTAAGTVAAGLHATQHKLGGADPVEVALVGALSGLPAPGAANNGKMYYATDQDALYIGAGGVWIRVGAKAGDIIWTNESVARTGYILLQGQAWPATTGIYADLFAKWGGTNLPDLQGRTAVALGTNATVNALLTNDGVAVANRRGTLHRHTPHLHTIYNFFSGGVTASGALAAINNAGGTTNTSSADGGSGVATDPLDGGAFIVLQPQAKL